MSKINTHINRNNGDWNWIKWTWILDHTPSGMLSIVPNGGGVPASDDVLQNQNRPVDP